MQLLLRKISSDHSGIQEYMDSEIDRDEIVIGSSPRSDIQLLDSGIAAVHARLKQQGGKARLVAEKGKSFFYNGEPQRSADLKQGDEIRIGSQVFRCAAPVPGFDLNLEWQYLEMPGRLLSNAYRTSLAELNFSPRKLSWFLALATLLLLGIAPMLEYFWQAAESGGEAKPARQLDLGSMWLSGPLLPAHQVALGNDCGACHQSAFVQVEDQACQQCHGEVGDHLSQGHPGLADLGEFANFDQFACQNCHKEHNEPQSLIASSDSLCRSCHQEMRPSIKGFTAEHHPQFKLSMLQPDLQQLNGTLSVNWQLNKVSPHNDANTPVEEESHLNYPHDIHLDAEAVRHPRRDDALQCVDCHTLSSDREHFETISMEKHCASCHDLSFDERNPQKQLPHGSPEAVFDALEAHFVKLAFSEQQSTGFERRRLPGRERSNESCEGDYDCARQQALREADMQFSQRGCVTCHQVDELAGAEEVERWQVLPVKINHDWFRDARFDHQSHLTQAEQSGDALCLTCHDAASSNASADVLMPDLAQCTECHGDSSVDQRVAVNCISCHGYHGNNGDHISHPDTRLTGGATEFLKGVVNGEL